MLKTNTHLKKMISAIFLGLGLSSAALANDSSLITAKAIAVNTYTKALQSNNLEQVEVTHVTSEKDQEGNVLFYTLQMNQKGFVMVSAIPGEESVLAYSLENGEDIEAEEEDNVAFRGLMNHYANSLISQQTSRSLNQEILLRDNASVAFLTVQKTKSDVVAPLTTTKWTQNGFYNDQVPKDSLTGCVATAMAQFLKYHNYPAMGIGTHGYEYSDQDRITVDYGTTSYSWSAMPDRLTSENFDVAQLMFHTGVSVNTLYGSSVSLARMAFIPEALDENFGYLTHGFEYASNYQPEVWRQKILDELLQDRPIVLTGHTGHSAGHAWILDGHDGSGFFHMNWGWGGRMNGYFSLDKLQPTTDYNFGQKVAMVRAAPKNLPLCKGTKNLSNNTGKVSDGSNDWSYQNNTDCKYVIEAEEGKNIRLNFSEFDVEQYYDHVTVYDGDETNAPVLGRFDGNQLPPSVTTTSGKMLIHFSADYMVNKSGWSANYITVN